MKMNGFEHQEAVEIAEIGAGARPVQRDKHDAENCSCGTRLNRYNKTGQCGLCEMRERLTILKTLASPRSYPKGSNRSPFSFFARA